VASLHHPITTTTTSSSDSSWASPQALSYHLQHQQQHQQFV
jgi:hypothetical protein